MQRRAHHTATSPCFRTNAAGDILLRPEWIDLLDCLAGQGEWIVQSRHPFARLFARASLPDWQFDPEQSTAHDPASRLTLSIEQWHHAVVRLRSCNCCESPGYVEFYNASGQAVLQFRAPPDRTVSRLAEIASVFAAGSALRPVHLARGNTTRFPVLSAENCDRQPAAVFPRLLERLRSAQVSVTFRLCTEEFDHRRTFTPRRISEDEHVLTVSDGEHQCCQLILPLVHSVVHEIRSDAPLLHVLAADNAVLLSLSPGGDAFANRVWHSAVAGIFPHLPRP